MMDNPILLASKSPARKKLLTGAGVKFESENARIDEVSVRRSLQAENAKPLDIVNTLAAMKAKRIARRHVSALVIGCDQILVCEGEIFGKSKSMEQAKQTLKKLKGKPHTLLSAAVIYDQGEPVWRHTGRAQLVMRDFSDEFLKSYLFQAGEDILSSVGCYFVEGRGAQLFTRIQGDYFTILGLPLLEILAFLRRRNMMDR